MVSVCLPSDALLQHLPSYLGFSYLGRGVSLHGCSSKTQPLLLTLDEGYLLTTALPDLQHGIAPLGPPAPMQPLLLGRGVGPPGRRPWPWAWGRGVALPGCSPWPWMRGNSSHHHPWPRTLGSSSRLPLLTSDLGYLLLAVPAPSQPGTLSPAPDLGRIQRPWGISSWTWGNSSWPPPFRHGVLPASAPDLGRGVAPHSRA